MPNIRIIDESHNLLGLNGIQPLRYALIVVALPDQPAEIFEFNYDHLVDYWSQWHNRLKIFYDNVPTPIAV